MRISNLRLHTARLRNAFEIERLRLENARLLQHATPAPSADWITARPAAFAVSADSTR